MALKPPRSAPRPIADLVDSCLSDVLAAQGFARANLIMAWPEIVGESLAQRCAPARIDWPSRRAGPGERPEPATLVVRVEGAFALELQHMADIVLERINAHMGWRCIGRLVLKQGPLPRPARRPPPRPLTGSEAKHLAETLASVDDPRLKEALARLGEGVLRGGTPP